MTTICVCNEIKSVPGLYLIENIFSETLENQLIADIDCGTWKISRTKERRVQMLGPWHDNKYKIDWEKESTPLAPWCIEIANIIKQTIAQFDILNKLKLNEYDLCSDINTNVFVNEYKHDGSGLALHFDSRATFKEAIFGLSLGHGATMTFRKDLLDLSSTPGKYEIHQVYIPPRSLYIMTGPSRYNYEHGFITGYTKSCTKTDTNNNSDSGVVEYRRVSLTFREIKPKEKVVIITSGKKLATIKKIGKSTSSSSNKHKAGIKNKSILSFLVKK